MKNYLLTVLIFFRIISLAQQGSLDIGFGSGGLVTTDFGNDYAYGYSSALQNDGKIVMAGENNYHFALARYNTNGSLDNTFDSDGKVSTKIEDESYAKSVCIQNDGKIIVGGFCIDGSNSFFTLVRYNSNGSLDQGFDGDGIVKTVIGNAMTNRISSIRLQADGKILAAGECDGDFALIRYNTDGSLDSTFSNDGSVTIDLLKYNDICTSLAIFPDGKILLAGRSFNGINTAPSHCALVRFTASGILDTAFSADGIETLPIGGFSSSINSIALQPDGKIVAAGMSYNVTSSWDFTVLRYNNNGTLDSTFSSDGMVTTNVGSDGYAYSVTLQADGKILVAGNTNNSTSSDFALVRYHPNGSLDNTFDQDGIVTTSIGNYDDHACTVLIQTDHKIVVGGFSYDLTNDSYDFALARYHFNDPTDVADNKEKNIVSIYPNPSSGKITVALEKSRGQKISIYDVFGKCVFEDVTVKHTDSVDLSTLPKAIYFLEISSEYQRVIRKIVLE